MKRLRNRESEFGRTSPHDALIRLESRQPQLIFKMRR